MNPTSYQATRWLTRLGSVCLLAGSVASADPVPTLRFDPFRTPPDAGANGRSPAQREDVRETFVPVLRSTIVSESRALVNLGGEVIAIGEETHGYRLIAVGLYDAVFEKDGRRVRLEVSGEKDERS